MTRKKQKFQGMGYREVQKSNSENWKKLDRQQQKALKEKGHRNIGWLFVTRLYLGIEDLNQDLHTDDTTLEELFLNASWIGDKYQTNEDKLAFRKALDQAIEETQILIDEHFPGGDIQMIDYSKT
jgi:hypothetical protein